MLAEGPAEQFQANHHLLVGLAAHRLLAQAGEVAGQFVKLHALPAVERMIVALGALNLDAEEDARRLGSAIVDRVVAHVREQEKGSAVLLVRLLGRAVADRELAFRGQHLLDHRVPMLVVAELLGQPGFEVHGHRLCPAIGDLGRKHVAPITCPVLGVIVAGQQLVDELGPLVRILVGGNLGHVGRQRQPASQIEHHAPQELLVAGLRRRRHLGRRLLLGDQAIDFPGLQRRIRNGLPLLTREPDVLFALGRRRQR